MDRYKKFFKEVLANEGEFQKHSSDKGNYHNGELYGTLYGITARDHFGTFMTAYLLWNKGLKDKAEQVAMEFYQNNEYWNKYYEKIESEQLAFKLFDFGINAGPARAVKLLQEVLVSLNHNLEIDGEFGPITLNIVNEENQERLYESYVARLEKYYKSLKGFSIFGTGWLKRLKKVFKWQE